MKKGKYDLNEIWYNQMFSNYILKQHASLNNPRNYNKRESNIDMSGKWSTNWGFMKLVQEGNVVNGTYEWDNGRIEGILDGDNFKGNWLEPPTYSCPNFKGGFNFKVSITGKSFEGRWSYCDLMDAGTWIGTKIIKPEITSVAGSWKFDNRILLLEEGNGKIDGTCIDGLNENPIRLCGDIVKDDKLNKLKVDGEWTKGPTNECPDCKGKLYMEFDIPIRNTKIYLLDCNGKMDKSKIFEGIRTVGPEPLDISGDWHTNFGKIQFVQNEGIVLGSYRLGKAIMEGRMIGNVLIGKWYELCNYSCPYDSGDVKLIFSTNARVFDGYWSYCYENFNSDNVCEGVNAN